MACFVTGEISKLELLLSEFAPLHTLFGIRDVFISYEPSFREFGLYTYLKYVLFNKS